MSALLNERVVLEGLATQPFHRGCLNSPANQTIRPGVVHLHVLDGAGPLYFSSRVPVWRGQFLVADTVTSHWFSLKRLLQTTIMYGVRGVAQERVHNQSL